MSSIQRVCRFGLVVACASAAAFLLTAPAAARAGDTYASIAYSNTTGSYGVGSNVDSREKADKAALAACKGDDAKVVCWVSNGVRALALDANKHCGYCGNNDGTYVDASKMAIAEFRAISGAAYTAEAGAFVVLVSSDSAIVVTEPAPPAGTD